ncbi:MAG: hypothetical protein ACYDHH_04950 [Solirubrobacteraceae bacterium]
MAPHPPGPAPRRNRPTTETSRRQLLERDHVVLQAADPPDLPLDHIHFGTTTQNPSNRETK